MVDAIGCSFHWHPLFSFNNNNNLEGTASYWRLLLAPAEGWWPSDGWDNVEGK